MPFELGLDLGCRRFGAGALRGKRMLILDARRYRFQAFISDIAGQDVEIHGNRPRMLIKRVRDWLRVNGGGGSQAGDATIARWFRGFTHSLPELCRRGGLDRRNLLFVDYLQLAGEWIEARRRAPERSGR